MPSRISFSFLREHPRKVWDGCGELEGFMAVDGFFLRVGLWCFIGDFEKNGWQNVVFVW
jgi:hypothetical protein